jgi:hypothetical protein
MIYDGNVMKQSDGKMDVKEVTDSKGNKYYVDDPSGEAAWNYPYVSKGILGMTGAKLEYLDLSDAVFPVQTDLNISLSHSGVKKVLLPTSKQHMWLIPDGAFNNCHYIEELCIPHNYTKIGSRAFYNTHALKHIYTTSDPNNSDDEFVDNGPNTFTFASTLKEIEGGVSGAEATFFGSQMDNVTDIYVLATVAPKCGANAFAASMTYGNNGFAGNWVHPIRRENYNNNDKWICVLHYPTDCEESQAKNYTDITRKYTLNDEVGDVDGTGKPMVWPRHAEFFRAYNQAVNGVTWGAWQEKEEGAQEVIRTLEEAKNHPIDNTKNYDQAYQGWHEFVLTGNSNSMEIDVQKETEFVQRDWYTLCVPYDLKKSQMLELFGIDLTKSANNKVKMLGATEYTAVTETMYPDVRVLTEVSRSVKQEKMTLHLSKPLLNDSEGRDWAVVIPDSTGQGYSYEELTGDDPVIIKGGHPFLVRGYIPEIWSEKIKNMGMYIMAVAASDNKVAALEGKTEQELPYQFNAECFDEHNIPLPCVKHHIHARNADQDPNVVGDEYVYIDAGKSKPACYHFIGTYSTTTIPQYAYYLGKSKSTGKHTFFRSTKATTSWNPYSAVIIGLNDPYYDPEDIEKEGSIALQNILVEWNEPQSDLVVLPGENPALAGKPFSFVIDEEGKGEPTGIVDVNLKENVKVNNNKVYGINGQYIGTSLKNLPKGIYIINGQKFVVK